jgi:hypothetical protein
MTLGISGIPVRRPTSRLFRQHQPSRRPADAKTIPIVVIAEEMLEVGLVTSLARPDGNTTGVSGFVPELDGKRVEILGRNRGAMR